MTRHVNDVLSQITGRKIESGALPEPITPQNRPSVINEMVGHMATPEPVKPTPEPVGDILSEDDASFLIEQETRPAVIDKVFMRNRIQEVAPEKTFDEQYEEATSLSFDEEYELALEEVKKELTPDEHAERHRVIMAAAIRMRKQANAEPSVLRGHAKMNIAKGLMDRAIEHREKSTVKAESFAESFLRPQAAIEDAVLYKPIGIKLSTPDDAKKVKRKEGDPDEIQRGIPIMRESTEEHPAIANARAHHDALLKHGKAHWDKMTDTDRHRVEDYKSMVYAHDTVKQLKAVKKAGPTIPPGTTDWHGNRVMTPRYSYGMGAHHEHEIDAMIDKAKEKHKKHRNALIRGKSTDEAKSVVSFAKRMAARDNT